MNSHPDSLRKFMMGTFLEKAFPSASVNNPKRRSIKYIGLGGGFLIIAVDSSGG